MTPAILAVILALVLVVGGFIIANQRAAALPPKAPEVPKAPKVPSDLAPSTLPSPESPAAPAPRAPAPLPSGRETAPQFKPAEPAEPTAPAAEEEILSLGAIEALPSVALQVAPSTARLSIPPGSAHEVEGLRRRLGTPRAGFLARLASLFRGAPKIDAGVWERMEEVLLTSDVGVATTERLVKAVRAVVESERVSDAAEVWRILKAEAHAILAIEPKRPLVEEGKTNVILMVGVNGVGKTTTIGKLATRWKTDGRTVVLGAADTFRAAAVAQLEAWGRRIGVGVVKGKDGADPASVAFETAKRGLEESAQVVLVDTAGRLQTKAPLMDELKKIHKSLGKACEGAPHETLLVLDATTGQNALQQAVLFREAAPLTGIVLTKLDGTAKGGIILAICAELGLPVRFVGLGERADDLRPFHANDFVEALFGEDPSAAPEATS
jgi:fused signal recognition particle receptor